MHDLQAAGQLAHAHTAPPPTSWLQPAWRLIPQTPPAPPACPAVTNCNTNNARLLATPCSQFGETFHKTATFDENLAFLKAMLHALYK